MRLIQIDFENGDMLLTEGRIIEVTRNVLWYIDRMSTIRFLDKVKKIYVS